MGCMKVGITGAGGYIGSRVTKLLIEEGHEVVPVDNFYAAKVESIKNREIIEADVRNKERITDLFEDVDVIMHLAALTGVEECNEKSDEAFNVNIRGTENIARVCREEGISLIFPCTMAVFGNPSDFPLNGSSPRKPVNKYGLTKRMSEQDIELLSEGAFSSHVFIISNAYGFHEIGGEKVEKSVVINYFISRCLAREPITVYEPGTQERDFIHVKDIADAYLCSAEALQDEDEGSTSMTIASERSISIIELAEIVQEKIEDKTGYRPEVKKVENPRENESLNERFDVDASRAREEIGFEAERSLEENIEKMIEASIDT